MASMRRFELFRIKALAGDGGHTLYFATKAAGRGHPAKMFKLGDVPDFEGDSALFHCERRGGQWRVLRRVS
jgi:hypothetical protein